MHGTTGPSWLGVSGNRTKERFTFPHGHRSDLAEFEIEKQLTRQFTPILLQGIL
jgi:hypothetical protein